MSKKLYVGGLPYSVDDAQLNEMVAPFAAVVSAKVVQDKYSGRSKGFGFVEVASDEDAQKVIDGLNGTEIGGRSIKVDVARPMAPRTGGGGGGGGGPRRGGGYGGGGGGGRQGNRW